MTARDLTNSTLAWTQCVGIAVIIWVISAYSMCVCKQPICSDVGSCEPNT